MKFNVKTMTLTSTFIALTYILTAFVRIPVGGGYFNLGDIPVLFAAIYIHPLVGVLAGAIGASLADLSGFAIFIPFTIVAKSLEALISAFLFSKIKGQAKFLALFIGSISMVVVYGFSYLLIDPSWILIGTPFDILQAVVAASGTSALYILLKPYKERLIS